MKDISIIIICHHDRGYLQEAIDSANNQTFERNRYEIILQIDSTKTMAQNTNHAVKIAKGTYIKWLHDDDILLPNCLQTLWDNRADADMIMGDVLLFGDVLAENDPYHMQELPESLAEFIEYNPINQAGCMYKKQILLDNPLDESLWTAEEYELNLRLFSQGYKFKAINEPVAMYRIHEAMKSASSYNSDNKEIRLKRDDAKKQIRDKYRKML